VPPSRLGSTVGSGVGVFFDDVAGVGVGVFVGVGVGVGAFVGVGVGDGVGDLVGVGVGDGDGEGGGFTLQPADPNAKVPEYIMPDAKASIKQKVIKLSDFSQASVLNIANKGKYTLWPIQ
jgi:hypothetical protein